MKNNWQHLSVLGLVIAAVGLPVQFAIAQEAADDEDDLIEVITTIGSRSSQPRSASDKPVAVDSIGSESMQATGQTEVGRMLQSLAPSFNFSSSSISDGTDALRPATLRGLGPDQTLVLVNGKRRHQASLIHINTSVGRGTAGTDMNAIPAASIKRIEVLRDGAAAQYGSDAIAGVINIVLDDDSEGGHFGVSAGEYSEGDGQTTNVDFSKGFELGDAGFLHAAFNFRDRDFTNRAGLHGSCQFPGCVDTDGNGILEPGDPREVTAPRDTFRIGDAISEQFAMTLNTAIELGDGELYGFVTYSNRDNESAAFFRHNANTDGNAPMADGDATIPAGFLPKINSENTDLSYNFGYKVEFSNDASLDVSITDGGNTIDYVTSDSINSSFANAQRFTTTLTPDEIRATVPREAAAYGLELNLRTINLDFTQTFGDFFFAMGAELRTDEYKIIAGEEYSYRDYDTENGVSLFAEDRAAGIQGFPGIGPQSAVDEERDVFSVYLDGEYSFSENLLVNGAVRYDDYDGFGDTANFKLAANFGLTDNVRLRGAVSSGFRAPSMQQLYFNNVGTQFVPDVNDVDGDGDVTELIAVQVGTFRNDSTLAQAIGIPALKEEESTNFSVGIAADITDRFNVTIDYYSIDIDDRIVISNRLGSGLSSALDAALIQAGAGAGQFFLNGADTETDGFDIVAEYAGIELAGGDLDLTLAANFTETDVVKVFTPSGSGLESVDVEDVFNAQDISIIEEWQPEDRISFNASYMRDALAVNLALNRYGEYTVTDGGRQTYGAELLTDIHIAYSFENGITLNLTGNNIFDVTPDKNEIGNSRAGAIEDGPGGPIIVDSAGVFQFSRRSAPFGFNGAYFSAGFSWDF
ncbi:MAG: TonB-dependent receptor [Gammaproteobacteria bacterium]|nr:TonB-dependent receptor [Gammaproteobacteria bacterium]MDH3373226.1 TonB-dependent receptor [Gammaproteobacteria bacterium]